jgi:xylulokinase
MEAMNDSYLIGLDAGTTSIKGLLISVDGTHETVAQKEYSLEYIEGEIVELNPEIYWETTLFIINQLLTRSGVSPEKIRAVSFASQGETLIAVDKNGKPLMNAIVWLDNRSIEEAKTIEQTFTRQTLLEKTGQPEILPIWPATKILWLKNRESDIFNKVGKFLLVEDYLIYKLTGKYYSEETLASSTLYFDIRKKKWWYEMLDFLNISPQLLPNVLPSGTATGKISTEAVAATGLCADTIIVTGAYDHVAGAIGSGNIREGIISETTGASMAMVVTTDDPVLNLTLNLPCQCHAVPGKYFLLPYGQTAGMVLKWFRDEFFVQEKENALRENKNPYDLMTALAEKVPAGSEGLTMLPHLMGAGSPEFDVHVKGVFAGITPQMGKGHFIRAIMESVACMIKKNLDSLQNHGIAVTEIRALGGGAESDLWNQIKADMTGIPFVTLQSHETACLGAAILAGIGCGLFHDFQDGEKMVQLKNKYMPDGTHHAKYQEVYEKYIKLYDHLKDYW